MVSAVDITVFAIGREGGSRRTNLGTKILHFSKCAYFALFFAFFNVKLHENTVS